MTRWKFVLFFLFVLVSFPVKTKNQVYFSPNGKCEKEIIDRINSAEKYIDASVYSINNDNIVEALLNAKKRQVNIRILTDRTQAKGRSSLVKYLFDNGIDIKVHSKYKIEHNKFAIYDRNKGSTGSFNWTNPAQNMNSENCLFFDDKETTDEYLTHFEYLWEINTDEKSKNWIESHFE